METHPGESRAKIPFQIATALKRIESAVAPFRPAMLFELAELGFRSPFQQLIACLISIRTLDEVSRESSLRLLRVASDPAGLARLEEAEIRDLIEPATFSAQKAKTLKSLAAEIANRRLASALCEREVLLSLKGVGPKCAGLVLGVACGVPSVAVDIHVHRVSNRWGIVAASTPEKTMRQLEAVVPRFFWIELNRLLVPFGKHICTGARPRCSRCPVLEMCQQVGVRNPR